MKNNIWWNDSSLEKNRTNKTIIYRSKWEVRNFAIDSTLWWFEIIVNNWERIIEFDDIPEKIDLTNVPVVCIWGKKWKQQEARLEEFKKNAPDFKWVIFLLPYSWANWWGDGKLLIPDEKILWWKKISGEKVVIAEENERFLSDGKFVADKVKKLGSKILETLEQIEKEPWPNVIAEILCKSYSNLTISLYKEIQEVISTLKSLEQKRVLLTWEDPRDIRWMVQNILINKLKNLGITKLTSIPENFHLSYQEIDASLYEQRDVLGKVDIPWIWYKEFLSQRVSWHAVVELTLDDLKLIKNWPYKDIWIYIKEIYPYHDWERLLRYWDLHELLFVSIQDDNERRQNILKYYQELSKKVQKEKNYPKEIELEDAHIVDLPQNPEPFVWWKDSITNEEYVCYPAVVYENFPIKHWWKNRRVLKWFDTQEEANNIDKISREEANSYVVSRKIKLDLLSDVDIIPFPFNIPEKYTKKMFSPEDMMDIIGLDKDKYVIYDKVNYWYTKPTSGYRDPDYWWEPGTDWSATFLKEENGKIYIAKMGFDNLFESFHVQDARCWMGWLLVQLWFSNDKIQEVKVFLEQQKEKSFNEYERKTQSIKQKIISSDEFSYLPISVQEKINNEYSYLYDFKDELIKSRSDATNLMKNKNILVNWWWSFRTMWATNNQEYRVIMPDGKLRLPDHISYRKHYRDEWEKIWDIVWPEELAISRNKWNTAADHQFVIDKLPLDWLTEEQKKIVLDIEDEISDRWSSMKWMSGNSSPDIGEWWDLWDVYSNEWDDSIDDINKWTDFIEENQNFHENDIMKLLSSKFGNVKKIKK
jgi:hypothetical protein